jgi:hypothetical protein
METYLLITALLALFGSYLVSNGNWQGFAIWLVTNSVFALHNYLICEWVQMGLFMAYFIIAINGIRNLLNNNKDRNE